MLNLVGELIIAKSMLHQTVVDFQKRFPKDPLKTRFADALAFQSRILNDLQKSVMKIRMVPVEHLFRRFPRVVRDVAKSCGKDVALLVTGQDTDLDKSILDMLAEPLAHLVRNSVDHGIESPEERVSLGKSAQGTVRLAAYHQGNQIVIEVGDDGRGIDRDRLVAKAVENGLLSQADAAVLSEQEVLDLVFHPGLSTAEEVTSISGRGVGMDVVKSVLDRLKGSVSIRTIDGKGTTFYLKVPLTLAIIKALLFHVGERTYAVPLTSVAEIIRSSYQEIHSVDGHDVIQLRGEILPLVHLGGLAEAVHPGKKMFIVVATVADRRFGLVVDKLIGEEELVIKALDDHLVATELVTGASILGDGTVVLILNIPSVVSQAGTHAGFHGGHCLSKRIKVLVVDDSALMRKMIPQILARDTDIEVVGTAMDGEFGLKKIEDLNPDVVTLDLEMPRMDGMETLRQITRRFRVPVIIVSALSTEGATRNVQGAGNGRAGLSWPSRVMRRQPIWMRLRKT